MFNKTSKVECTKYSSSVQLQIYSDSLLIFLLTKLIFPPKKKFSSECFDMRKCHKKKKTFPIFLSVASYVIS